MHDLLLVNEMVGSTPNLARSKTDHYPLAWGDEPQQHSSMRHEACGQLYCCPMASAEPGTGLLGPATARGMPQTGSSSLGGSEAASLQLWGAPEHSRHPHSLQESWPPSGGQARWVPPLTLASTQHPVNKDLRQGFRSPKAGSGKSRGFPTFSPKSAAPTVSLPPPAAAASGADARNFESGSAGAPEAMIGGLMGSQKQLGAWRTGGDSATAGVDGSLGVKAFVSPVLPRLSAVASQEDLEDLDCVRMMSAASTEASARLRASVMQRRDVGILQRREPAKQLVRHSSLVNPNRRSEPGGVHFPLLSFLAVKRSHTAAGNRNGAAVSKGNSATQARSSTPGEACGWRQDALPWTPTRPLEPSSPCPPTAAAAISPRQSIQSEKALTRTMASSCDVADPLLTSAALGTTQLLSGNTSASPGQSPRLGSTVVRPGPTMQAWQQMVLEPKEGVGAARGAVQSEPVLILGKASARILHASHGALLVLGLTSQSDVMNRTLLELAEETSRKEWDMAVGKLLARESSQSTLQIKLSQGGVGSQNSGSRLVDVHLCLSGSGKEAVLLGHLSPVATASQGQMSAQVPLGRRNSLPTQRAGPTYSDPWIPMTPVPEPQARQTREEVPFEAVRHLPCHLPLLSPQDLHSSPRAWESIPSLTRSHGSASAGRLGPWAAVDALQLSSTRAAPGRAPPGSIGGSVCGGMDSATRAAMACKAGLGNSAKWSRKLGSRPPLSPASGSKTQLPVVPGPLPPDPQQQQQHASPSGFLSLKEEIAMMNGCTDGGDVLAPGKVLSPTEGTPRCGLGDGVRCHWPGNICSPTSTGLSSPFASAQNVAVVGTGKCKETDMDCTGTTTPWSAQGFAEFSNQERGVIRTDVLSSAPGLCYSAPLSGNLMSYIAEQERIQGKLADKQQKAEHGEVQRSGKKMVKIPRTTTWSTVRRVPRRLSLGDMETMWEQEAEEEEEEGENQAAAPSGGDSTSQDSKDEPKAELTSLSVWSSLQADKAQRAQMKEVSQSQRPSRVMRTLSRGSSGSAGVSKLVGHLFRRSAHIELRFQEGQMGELEKKLSQEDDALSMGETKNDGAPQLSLSTDGLCTTRCAGIARTQSLHACQISAIDLSSSSCLRDSLGQEDNLCKQLEMVQLQPVAPEVQGSRRKTKKQSKKQSSSGQGRCSRGAGKGTGNSPLPRSSCGTPDSSSGSEAKWMKELSFPGPSAQEQGKPRACSALALAQRNQGTRDEAKALHLLSSGASVSSGSPSADCSSTSPPLPLFSYRESTVKISEDAHITTYSRLPSSRSSHAQAQVSDLKSSACGPGVSGESRASGRTGVGPAGTKRNKAVKAVHRRDASCDAFGPKSGQSHALAAPFSGPALVKVVSCPESVGLQYGSVPAQPKKGRPTREW